MIHSDMFDAQRKKRVVILHEHEVLRDGLAVLINRQDDFEVVASFGCAADATVAIAKLRPDLFITGCNATDSKGASFLAELANLVPECRRLVLAHHNSEDCIRAALLAGADAFVDLNSSLAELTAAMRTVCEGRHFVCNTTATRILSNYVSHGGLAPSANSPAASITEREREVLTRVALGCSNKAIARELGLSPKTVEKHRSNLMRKLQLHNAAAITMYAIRNGMTSPDPNRTQVQPHAGSHH